ncbi:MAG: hypothetical protein QMD92_03525 [bacterium]|nr:hypothetical protein [bacterium]
MKPIKKLYQKFLKISKSIKTQFRDIGDMYIHEVSIKKLDDITNLHKILKTLEKPAAKVSLLENLLSPQILHKRKGNVEFLLEAALLLIEIYEKTDNAGERINNLLATLKNETPLIAAMVYEKIDRIEDSISIYDKEKKYQKAYQICRHRGDIAIRNIPFFIDGLNIYQQYSNYTHSAAKWYLRGLNYLLLDNASHDAVTNFSLTDYRGEVDIMKCPARIILESSLENGFNFIKTTKDIFKNARKEDNKKLAGDLYKKFIDTIITIFKDDHNLSDLKSNHEISEIIKSIVSYHEDINYLYTEFARMLRLIGDEEGEKRIIKNIIKDRLKESISFTESILEEFGVDDLTLLIEELELFGKKSEDSGNIEESKSFFKSSALLCLKYIDCLEEKNNKKEIDEFAMRAINNYIKANNFLEAMELAMDYQFTPKAQKLAPMAIKELILKYEERKNKALIEKAIKFAQFTSLYKEEANLFIILNKPEKASKILKEHGEIEEAFNVLLEAHLSSKCLEIIKDMKPNVSLNYLNKLAAKYRKLSHLEKNKQYKNIYEERSIFFANLISQILSSSNISESDTIYASKVELMLQEEEKGNFEEATKIAYSALDYSSSENKVYLESKIKAYKDSLKLMK